MCTLPYLIGMTVVTCLLADDMSTGAASWKCFGKAVAVNRQNKPKSIWHSRGEEFGR